MSHQVAALDAKRPLAPQLWDHEKRARELGLQLVLELFTSKEPTSKAIGRIWSKERKLTEETLTGIYLVRLDVVAAGPKETLALTPYALFGVPLFVAWNPLGQVLTRAAFKEKDRADLVLVLSAFFHDVAHGKKHALHPAPMVPSGTPLKPRRKRRATKNDGTGGANPAPAPQPHGTRADATHAVTPDPPLHSAAPAESPIRELAKRLEIFIDNALGVARAFMREHDLRDDSSLHSLRQLDALLDEDASLAEASDLQGRALAAIGVYLGSVVQANAEAEWFVDLEQSSPIEAVALRVRTPDGDRVYRPIKIALDRLSDPDKGFYGHAVGMARRV